VYEVGEIEDIYPCELQGKTEATKNVEKKQWMMRNPHLFGSSLGFLLCSEQKKRLRLAPKMFWCNLRWVPEIPLPATTLYPIRFCRVANHGNWHAVSLTSAV